MPPTWTVTAADWQALQGQLLQDHMVKVLSPSSDAADRASLYGDVMAVSGTPSDQTQPAQATQDQQREDHVWGLLSPSPGATDRASLNGDVMAVSGAPSDRAQPVQATQDQQLEDHVQGLLSQSPGATDRASLNGDVMAVSGTPSDRTQPVQATQDRRLEEHVRGLLAPSPDVAGEASLYGSATGIAPAEPEVTRPGAGPEAGQAQQQPGEQVGSRLAPSPDAVDRASLYGDVMGDPARGMAAARGAAAPGGAGATVALIGPTEAGSRTDAQDSLVRQGYGGELVPPQFGSGLSPADAAAACGPAAAVAFARANGREPTIQEALAIAQTVGWTEGGGMNGIANQKALLDRMGIAASLETNPSWDRITADAQSGNPVTISTPRHYFVADGYDPATGQYHVGNSGTVFRNGAPWMTAAQIEAVGGGVNGALFANHPSVAAASPAAVGSAAGRGGGAAGQASGPGVSAETAGRYQGGDAGPASGQFAEAPRPSSGSPVGRLVQQPPTGSPVDRLGQHVQDLLSGIGQATDQAASAVGQTASNAGDQLQQHLQNLLNTSPRSTAPGQAMGGTFNALGTSLSNALGGSAEAPRPQPGDPTYLAPNNPILRVANGQTAVNPIGYSQAVGDLYSQQLPENVRNAGIGPLTVGGVVSQLGNPMWTPGIGVADLAAAAGLGVAGKVLEPIVKPVLGAASGAIRDAVRPALEQAIQYPMAAQHGQGLAGLVSGRDVLPGAIQDVDPETFIALRNRSSRTGFLTQADPADLANHRLIVRGDEEHGFAGAAVSPEGDIQNVFNVAGSKGAKRRGAAVQVLLDAIADGGHTLDAFDGFLPEYYHKLGFEESARVPFNREYAPAGWDYARDGEPDVVLMHWAGFPQGETASDVAARIGADHSTITPIPARRFATWDEANAARRRLLDRGGSPAYPRSEPNPSADIGSAGTGAERGGASLGTTEAAGQVAETSAPAPQPP